MGYISYNVDQDVRVDIDVDIDLKDIYQDLDNESINDLIHWLREDEHIPQENESDDGTSLAEGQLIELIMANINKLNYDDVKKLIDSAPGYL